MNKLKAIGVILAAPLLDLLGMVRRWIDRRAGLRYYQVSSDYAGYLHRGEAAAFCLYHAKRFCTGSGVDVGAGRWPFPGARAVEDNPGENAYRLKVAESSQDFVFSSHCLEHLERWPEALLEWRRVLKPGGVLYLYLPHPACRMWRPDVLSHHLWQPEPDALAAHLAGIGFEIVESSVFPDAYLSFYVVARRA
ncbi:MAG: class I SAM-dependent methyltransferase [Rhodospirillaceae bacterium]